MEKTLTIDGKQVRFKSTGATPLRYKAQFGKDYLAELMKMNKLKGFDVNADEPDYSALGSLDLEIFYNIAWVLAKTADKTIPEPIEWLDEFDEFPMFEIIPELQDMISHSLQGKKKR